MSDQRTPRQIAEEIADDWGAYNERPGWIGTTAASLLIGAIATAIEAERMRCDALRQLEWVRGADLASSVFNDYLCAEPPDIKGANEHLRRLTEGKPGEAICVLRGLRGEAVADRGESENGWVTR